MSGQIRLGAALFNGDHGRLAEEVARLAAHGVLHLAGFDDHTDSGKIEMRRLEDAALRRGRAE